MKNDSVKLIKPQAASTDYNIIEEPLFSSRAAEIGDVKDIDEALCPIINGLNLKPDGFDKIPGTQIYRAKTNRIEYENKIIPSVRVYFRIEKSTVYLLDIEIAADDE